MPDPVDFSGSAALTVDTELPARTCRVPRALLLELLSPFVFGAMERLGFVATIESARALLERGGPEVDHVLSWLPTDARERGEGGRAQHCRGALRRLTSTPPRPTASSATK